MNQEQEKLYRAEISARWVWFMKIAETIHFGRFEQIEFRNNRPRFVRLVYDLNFEDVEDLAKKLEELRTLPIVE